MATIDSTSFLISPNLLQESTNPFKTNLSKLNLHTHKPQFLPLKFTCTRINAAAEHTSVTTADPSSVAARRLYVGNIPRTVKKAELQKIVEVYGAVEKAEVIYDKYTGKSRRFAFVTMKTVEDAAAAAEKLNGTQIGGREVKVNIAKKPLQTLEPSSLLQTDDSQFVDSPYKVYVGNLEKTVTVDTLISFFSEKAKVLGAKVSRVPGTSKISGYGFVTFPSEEDMDAAISSLNNVVLEGEKIRVNKA